MVEASTAITLEDIVNQYTNLGTRFESGLNQQKSDVNSSANRTSYEGIFDETVLQNVFALRSSKKDMERNENMQKIPLERVTKTYRKQRKKWKQHLELVPTMVSETKSESKVKVFEKTEHGDHPTSEVKDPIQEKVKGQVLRKGGESYNNETENCIGELLDGWSSKA
ncbi:hypothetical protein ACTXT7_010216 [Hymenolepis weldensis]